MSIKTNKKAIVLYLILILLILWYNYIYPSFVSSFVFYLFIALPVLSYQYTKRTFQKIKIDQYSDETIIKKEENLDLSVKFYVGNTDFKRTLNFFSPIYMNFNYSESLQTGFKNDTTIVLQEHKENVRDFRLTFKHRGVYEVGLKDIYTFDYLKLFEFRRVLSDFHQLKIYPDIIHLTHFPLPINQNDNFEIELFKNNDIFDGVKEYEAGDKLSRINWKTSAKLNKLYSKQFEKIGRNKTVCLINNIELGLTLEENIEYEEWFIESLLGVFSYFIDQNRGFDAVFLKDELTIHSVVNTEHFRLMYDDLSFVSFNDEVNLQLSADYYLKHYDYLVNLAHVIIFTSVLDNNLLASVYEFIKDDIVVEICQFKSNKHVVDEEHVLKELKELDVSLEIIVQKDN